MAEPWCVMPSRARDQVRPLFLRIANNGLGSTLSLDNANDRLNGFFTTKNDTVDRHVGPINRFVALYC